ncbi:MAG: hypothetical protein ACERKO_06860 [Acetanaerobacterium sp.]
MTITNQAAYYYKNYAFINSSAYGNNAVDFSKVSQKSYNVRNLTSALGVLAGAQSTNFATLRNVDSFVKSGYQAGGLDVYDSLKTAVSSSDVNDLLTGNTDLSGMYGLLGKQLETSTDQLFSELQFDPSASNAIASYTSYLSTTASESTLDITA